MTVIFWSHKALKWRLHCVVFDPLRPYGPLTLLGRPPGKVGPPPRGRLGAAGRVGR
jgi:hypothetical protein